MHRIELSYLVYFWVDIHKRDPCFAWLVGKCQCGKNTSALHPFALVPPHSLTSILKGGPQVPSQSLVTEKAQSWNSLRQLSLAADIECHERAAHSSLRNLLHWTMFEVFFLYLSSQIWPQVWYLDEDEEKHYLLLSLRQQNIMGQSCLEWRKFPTYVLRGGSQPWITEVFLDCKNTSWKCWNNNWVTQGWKPMF